MTQPTRSDAGLGTELPALPAGTAPGRAHLRVADLERSLGFYSDRLGLAVTRTGGDWVALAAPGGGRELLLLREVRGAARRPPRPVTTGLYHVALLLPSRAELGRALLGLREYPLRGASDHAVSESLYLDDPDGNGLEIYADRPRDTWRWNAGDVSMITEPMDVEGVVAAAGPGAEREPWPGLAAGTVVGHLHFTVSDLSRALAFYRDALGLAETVRLPAGRPSLVGLAAGGYHHHVNLNTWAGAGAAGDSDGVAGLDRWELVVPDAAAREALGARLGADAADSAPFRARDPDGIEVEIVAR